MKSFYLTLAICISAYAGELRTDDSPRVKSVTYEFTLDLDAEDSKSVKQDVKNMNAGDHLSFIEKKSAEDFEAKVLKYLKNRYSTDLITPEFSYKKENK
jgi:hypothetical protein